MPCFSHTSFGKPLSILDKWAIENKLRNKQAPDTTSSMTSYREMDDYYKKELQAIKVTMEIERAQLAAETERMLNSANDMVSRSSESPYSNDEAYPSSSKIDEVCKGANSSSEGMIKPVNGAIGFYGANKASTNIYNGFKKQIQADWAFDNMRRPINDRVTVPLFKTPKALKFVSKYGGYGFSVWGAMDIEAKYANGTITPYERGMEQIGNALGAHPVYGTFFTIGWEIGRAITETSGYQYWKASVYESLGGYYAVPRQYQRSLIDEYFEK